MILRNLKQKFKSGHIFGEFGGRFLIQYKYEAVGEFFLMKNLKIVGHLEDRI